MIHSCAPEVATAQARAATAIELWLEALQTPAGGALLEEWELTLADVRARLPFPEEPDEAALALKMMARVTGMTNPGPECVEQSLHGLLIDRESETARYLRGVGVDPSEAAHQLERRIQHNEPLSTYDLDAAQALAFRAGRTNLAEGDFLRLALDQPGLGLDILRHLGVDLEALRQSAAGWTTGSFRPSSRVERPAWTCENSAAPALGRVPVGRSRTWTSPPRFAGCCSTRWRSGGEPSPTRCSSWRPHVARGPRGASRADG